MAVPCSTDAAVATSMMLATRRRKRDSVAFTGSLLAPNLAMHRRVATTFSRQDERQWLSFIYGDHERSHRSKVNTPGGGCRPAGRDARFCESLRRPWRV